MNQEITKYVEKRYARWLDYARWHCSRINIEDKATEILNEVMLSIFEKKEEKVMRLYNSRKGNYRELDHYIMGMIKLNVYSETSPYQNKYKSIPVDDSVDFSRLKIMDESYDDNDKPGIILERINKVRNILDELDLSFEARKIFEYKFFHGNSFQNWNGPESKSYLYKTYKKLIVLIRQRINGETLI